MKQPRIIYKHVTINNKNVDSFLHVQKMAKYDVDSQCIIVYDYAIERGLDFARLGPAMATINNIMLMRPRSIAHETQHWRNAHVVDNVYDFCGCNYFQEISLYCLDELSAFTAGAFYSNPALKSNGANARTIIAAMDEGITEFLDGAGLTFYLEDLLDFVRDGVSTDIAERYASVYDLIDLQRQYKFDAKSLFGREFYDVVRRYFTFDGYCILDERNIPSDMRNIWRDIIAKCQRIKSAYLSRTNAMLGDIIRAGGNHH